MARYLKIVKTGYHIFRLELYTILFPVSITLLVL